MTVPNFDSSYDYNLNGIDGIDAGDQGDIIAYYDSLSHDQKDEVDDRIKTSIHSDGDNKVSDQEVIDYYLNESLISNEYNSGKDYIAAIQNAIRAGAVRKQKMHMLHKKQKFHSFEFSQAAADNKRDQADCVEEAGKLVFSLSLVGNTISAGGAMSGIGSSKDEAGKMLRNTIAQSCGGMANSTGSLLQSSEERKKLDLEGDQIENQARADYVGGIAENYNKFEENDENGIGILFNTLKDIPEGESNSKKLLFQQI
ncbi:MAG: hypothetical protein GY874_06205 [Desulfobacteraceae bacterium]|nr:hypothetical protein [Desulfobacteraceae bacterium]